MILFYLICKNGSALAGIAFSHQVIRNLRNVPLYSSPDIPYCFFNICLILIDLHSRNDMTCKKTGVKISGLIILIFQDFILIIHVCIDSVYDHLTKRTLHLCNGFLTVLLHERSASQAWNHNMAGSYSRYKLQVSIRIPVSSRKMDLCDSSR